MRGRALYPLAARKFYSGGRPLAFMASRRYVALSDLKAEVTSSLEIAHRGAATSRREHRRKIFARARVRASCATGYRASSIAGSLLVAASASCRDADLYRERRPRLASEAIGRPTPNLHAFCSNPSCCRCRGLLVPGAIAIILIVRDSSRWPAAHAARRPVVRIATRSRALRALPAWNASRLVPSRRGSAPSGDFSKPPYGTASRVPVPIPQFGTVPPRGRTRILRRRLLLRCSSQPPSYPAAARHEP